MFTPKFIVSIVLILYIDPLRSHDYWDKSKSITLSSYNRKIDVVNGTEMDYIKQLPMNAPISYNKNIDQMKRTRNDDDSFHYLITGGYRPENNELAKYVVSIRTVKEYMLFGDNHYCGGSIISPKIILTAAHCMFPKGGKTRPQKIKIVAGTPCRLQRTANTQEIAVEKIKTHSKYSQRSLRNDIALVKLKDEIKIDNEFTGVIPIADAAPVPNLQCTAIGWGSVLQFGPIPDELINGNVSIRETSYCSRIQLFSKGMLCANDISNYEVDSCQGDSGGPLICNGKVVGIVSFGYGCGEPDSAGVYTDVHHFSQWIIDNAATQTISLSPLCNIILLLSMILRLTGNPE